MRSTLFHIPAELAGIPVFGFGWLLAAWAVVAAIWLGLTFRRFGFNAETRGLAAFLALAGAMIAFVLPAISDSHGLPVRGYGVMLLLAVIVSCWLAVTRAQALGLDPDILYSLMFWLVAAGIVGARLFYVVQKWDQFRDFPLQRLALELVNVTQGGLVVYGGLLAGAAVFFWFAHRYRLPALALADLVAPSVALGMGLGRVGCFLNGCCFGGPCDLPWAVTFPAGSLPYWHQIERGQLDVFGLGLPADAEARPVLESVAPGSRAEAAGLRAGDTLTTVGQQKVATAGQALLALVDHAQGPAGDVSVTVSGRAAAIRWKPEASQRSNPIHPAQLYSAIDATLLAAFLWAYYPWRRRDGEVLAWLLTLHPISRFLLEIVRQDEGAAVAGLTISQAISLALFVTGIGLWAWLAFRPAGTAWPTVARA